MVVSPAWDRNIQAVRERDVSPAWDRNVQARRERSISPALDRDLAARHSTGIVPKQLQKNNQPGEGIVAEHFEDGALAATAKGRAAMASGYFDGATAADKFVDGSIPPAKINGGVGGGAATALKTTGADVTISGAAPPSTGQVLKATSATAASWQNEAGGGGGSAYIELGRATTLVLTGGTSQDIAWNSDVRNVGGIFTHAADSAEVTVSADGLYYFEARLASNDEVAWGKGFFYLRVNGTVVAHDNHQWIDVHDQTGASAFFTGAVGRFTVHLSAGDRVIVGASIQVFGVSDTVAATGSTFDTYFVGVQLAR
jgi:hypothetical protein